MKIAFHSSISSEMRFCKGSAVFVFSNIGSIAQNENPEMPETFKPLKTLGFCQLLKDCTFICQNNNFKSFNSNQPPQKTNFSRLFQKSFSRLNFLEILYPSILTHENSTPVIPSFLSFQIGFRYSSE